MIARAIACAWHVKADTVDGVLQIFNALRRLHVGQHPGTDFQYFHGIGVPLVHYPLYALFGFDLKAAELANQLLSPLATAGAFFVGWRFVTGRWRTALVLTAVSIAIADTAPINDTLYTYSTTFPIRTCLPIVACAALVLPMVPWRSGLLAGVLAGASVLVGTEQGVALMAAIVLVAAFEWTVGRDAAARVRLTVASVVAVVSWLILLLIITRGQLEAAASITRFNLSEVSEDQFWYFGSIQTYYIVRWHQLLEWPYACVPLGLMAGTAAVLLSLRWKRRGDSSPQTSRLEAGLIFATYGFISLVSLLGIYQPKNTHVCLRVAALLWLAMLYFGAWRAATSWPLRRWPAKRVLAVGGVLAMLAALALPSKYPVHGSLRALVANAREAARALRDKPTLDDSWVETMERFRAVAAGKEHPQLWSTFAGLPEAAYGVFNPDTDYIYHALGKRRRAAYLEKFRHSQPDVVQTELAARFSFESRLQSASWPFYESLIQRYVPAGLTSHSLLWRPRPPADPPALVEPPVPLQVGKGNTLVLPPPPADDGNAVEPRIAVVHLRYSCRTTLGWVPLLGATTRFLVHVEGSLEPDPIAVNPHADEAWVPVHLAHDQRPVLRVSPEGLLPGATIEVEAADVSFLSLPPAYAPFATSGLRNPPGTTDGLPAKVAGNNPHESAL